MSEPFEMEHYGVLAESGRAKLYKLGDTPFSNTVWIPNSEIIDEDEEAQTVLIPEWLAVDRGLV